MENIQKKQIVIPGNLPSQLCVLDSPATLRSSVLSFLFKFNPYSFPPKKPLHFSLFSSLCVFSFLFFFGVSSYSPVTKHGLPNHSPCCCTPAAADIKPSASWLPVPSGRDSWSKRGGGVPLTPQKNNQNCPLPSQKAPL